jgi:hypothetical protein
MIDRAIKARKEKLEKSQDLLVDMRPEFVDALKSAVAFSRKHFTRFTNL